MSQVKTPSREQHDHNYYNTCINTNFKAHPKAKINTFKQAKLNLSKKHVRKNKLTPILILIMSIAHKYNSNFE